MNNKIIGQRINTLLAIKKHEAKGISKRIRSSRQYRFLLRRWFTNTKHPTNYKNISNFQCVYRFILGCVKTRRNIKQHFSTRLKELREKNGLNQEQLAVWLGMSRGSVSFYENGERTPDIETLDIICDYFNVSYEYMLGERKNDK